MSDNELITIEAKIREKTGKGNNRKLRASGLVPANILDKTTSKMIELDPKWVSKAWKTGKKFNLSLNGVVRPVIIHELQIGAVKRNLVHLDLMYA